MHNGFERIFSSVPSHYSKGVSLAYGAYGNGCVMSHGCTITQFVPDNSLVISRRELIFSKKKLVYIAIDAQIGYKSVLCMSYILSNFATANKSQGSCNLINIKSKSQ